ncbi:MAG: hypothetical protein AAGF26_19800 [Cyanobacteria bacterium P01_G01_bin.49]
MNIDIFVGTWLLMGSISIKSELEFIGETPAPNSVQNWLSGQSDQLLDTIEPTEGLVLTIDPDGKFQEEKTGNPKIQWFDCEGVLATEVKPFGGCLKFFKSKVYLMADECPSWAKARDGKLRYNDGDTKICDSIEVKNNRLIRTISVVTDDMYFDRVVVVYTKAIA